MTGGRGAQSMQAGRAKRGLSPALVLFFLSPVTAELLSGSAPPAEFFQPLSLIVLCMLYGSGAILIRELALRWRKGWPSIFILGAAYGIVEEGLMVKSFFDPQWMDLGPLGVYGRWGGVNWVWSLGLTAFHAVWSISIPILLTTLMFPHRAREPWIGRRVFSALAVLLAVDVLFGFLALTAYRPPVIPYLLAILAVIALCIAARRMPLALRTRRSNSTVADKPHTRRCFALGLACTIAFFALLWAIPNTAVSAPGDMALMLLLAATAWLGLPRVIPTSRWDARHQLALANGALAFLIILAPLQELDPERALEMRGMTLVGLAIAGLLVWLGWRIRRFERDGVLPAALSIVATGEVMPFVK